MRVLPLILWEHITEKCFTFAIRVQVRDLVSIKCYDLDVQIESELKPQGTSFSPVALIFLWISRIPNYVSQKFQL